MTVWKLSRGPSLPAGISRRDYEIARQRLGRTKQTPPDHGEILFELGERLAERKRTEDARACYLGIEEDHFEYGNRARLLAGILSLELNQARVAETLFRKFLEARPAGGPVSLSDQATALDWLIYLDSVELRFEDRRRLLKQLHQLGLQRVSDSKMYYFPSLLIWNSTRASHRLEEFLSATPDDRVLLTAQGRYLMASGQIQEAIDLLTRLHAAFSNEPEIQAALVESLYEQDDWKEISKVFAAASPTNSDSWLLSLMRGEFSIHERRYSDAVTHFERVIGDDPANITAWMGLLKVRQQNGSGEADDSLPLKIRVLAEIRPALSRVQEDDADACEWLAEQCRRIDLTEAATTFQAHSARIRQSRELNSNPQERAAGGQLE
ncbi:MAG: hypothetical protein R3C49_03155 [Planctomycetaceae bacterium]